VYVCPEKCRQLKRFLARHTFQITWKHLSYIMLLRVVVTSHSGISGRPCTMKYFTSDFTNTETFYKSIPVKC